MVFYLALRNISKNKKDNAIIAVMIAVITFLFFIGNSVIEKVDLSIRRAFIESLTGDVVLEKTGDVTMNLFGANTPVIDSFFTIPVLPAYDEVMEIAASETGIAGITSQVSGRAYMDLLGVREPVLLCGIDAASYFPLFPGILLEEGRFLRANEYGAMITSERADRIERQSGQKLLIGMPLLFTSLGATGFKIREVPLTGIYRYQNPGHFMNEIIIADPQTVRVLNSIQVAGEDVDIGDDSIRLLGADVDDFFSEAWPAHTLALALDNEIADTEFSVDFLQSFLNESRMDASGEEIGGGWNFIILRLDKGISPRAFISSLNRKIEPFGVMAVNWRIASGTSSISTLLIQALFNSGIFLVCVVGIFAIINILLISVFRRVREIGTLRTIGASDLYIRSLIYCENLLIAMLAGCAGVFGGSLFFAWINSLNIQISNELILTIMGGSAALRIDFLPPVAGISLCMALILGLAASVYPVETAVRIKPMEAVRRG